MQDRVPRYPGRVKLTPVSGQANTYDMVRADNPTQKGDPINKNTLLKDTTAALFGLGKDAVPDGVFNQIKTLIDSKVNAVYGSYVGTGTYGESKPNRLTFDFEPKIIFIGDIVPEDRKWSKGSVLMIKTDDSVTHTTYTGNSDSTGILHYTFRAKTVEWYNRDDKVNQLNNSGTTYRYLVIG